MNAIPGPEESLRTFVATHVPAGIQTQLAEVMAGFRQRLPSQSVRWVRPENIHLTLRFIGNLLPSELDALNEAVRDAAGDVEPFALQLAQPGCFPAERSPRVLWVGLSGDLEPLDRLQARVLEATVRWGRIDEKAFHPHLTLGRVTTKRRSELQQIGDAVRRMTVPACPPWRVSSLHVMQSRLAAGGSVYSTLASAPVTG